MLLLLLLLLLSRCGLRQERLIHVCAGSIASWPLRSVPPCLLCLSCCQRILAKVYQRGHDHHQSHSHKH